MVSYLLQKINGIKFRKSNFDAIFPFIIFLTLYCMTEIDQLLYSTTIELNPFYHFELKKEYGFIQILVRKVRKLFIVRIIICNTVED